MGITLLQRSVLPYPSGSLPIRFRNKGDLYFLHQMEEEFSLLTVEKEDVDHDLKTSVLLSLLLLFSELPMTAKVLQHL